jgi:hypothetical protein
MSFSSLPYDLLHEIVSYLDPDLARSPFEAPSVTKARRQVGRQLALISHNSRLVGTEFVWRRLVVGFHRNPELLARALEEVQEGSLAVAEHVRQLHVFCRPRNAVVALGAQLETVLPALSKLETLVVAATPPVIDRILEGARRGAGITNIGHLQLASSSGSSPTFPSRLLDALPLFTGVRTLDVELRLPPDTAFPSTSASSITKSLRPQTVFLNFEEVSLAAYPSLNTFICRFIALLSLPHLQSFSLFSPYCDSSFFPSLTTASALTSLVIALKVGPLKTRLSDLSHLLPSLTQLEKLSLFVLPPVSAPLILPPADPLRPALLAALPPSLQHAELDIDFMYPPGDAVDDYARIPSPDVYDFVVDKAGRGRALRTWRTVEWEEAMGLRRECLASKVVEAGLEVWKFEG